MGTAAGTPRARILETAGRLFYERGYHAVGIDTIVAESGVAKMTLYRHFPSKDALVVAYLERVNGQIEALFDAAVQGIDSPAEQLRAICAAVARLASTPQCLGCAFQMSALEFPGRDHPANQAALAHKRAVRGRLLALAQQARLRDPEQLADQLSLLIDGAWAAARVFGPHSPAASMPAAADLLIAAQQP